jgi:hypothetical protein
MLDSYCFVQIHSRIPQPFFLDFESPGKLISHNFDHEGDRWYILLNFFNNTNQRTFVRLQQTVGKFGLSYVPKKMDNCLT